DVPPRPLFQRHVAGATSDLDLEGTMAALVPLARFRGQKCGRIPARGEVQIVEVQRRVVARHPTRTQSRPTMAAASAYTGRSRRLAATSHRGYSKGRHTSGTPRSGEKTAR